jgi:hypothetical protein
MSSSGDEAHSPELGASSAKDPPPPLESESEHAEQKRFRVPMLTVRKMKKFQRKQEIISVRASAMDHCAPSESIVNKERPQQWTRMK